MFDGLGNDRCNGILEEGIGAAAERQLPLKPAMTDPRSDKEAFIKAKYEQRAYVLEPKEIRRMSKGTRIAWPMAFVDVRRFHNMMNGVWITH
eukprot:SAG31_NODE_4_length_45662_cov_15.654622_22_plen_92_part_00